MPYKPIPTVERFWSKVGVTTDEGCWPWLGASDSVDGRGQFWNGKGLVRAPRFMWELMVGPIPDGLLVLHRCDNPPCVNPAHLFLGTHSDNSKDAVAKGQLRPQEWVKPFRVPRGEAHWNAKLTKGSVRAIRQLQKSGWTHQRIAAKFDISRSSVGLIVNNKRLEARPMNDSDLNRRFREQERREDIAWERAHGNRRVPYHLWAVENLPQPNLVAQLLVR